ncbi:hypothetical protein [Microvirga roseola]|uniref:hypothetical protein n=1 Tax=Microvirga roseola TaxID=2883126 RepID=UPI001E3044B2|nr:hypothetical protein [Microvirga roseola]
MTAELEKRIAALENDRAGLEWMVVYLAKKLLVREDDTFAAARAMQEEITAFGRAFVDYSLRPEIAAEDKRRAMEFSSNISFMAKQIIDEVRNSDGRTRRM